VRSAAATKADDGTASLLAVNQDMREDLLVTVARRAFVLKSVREDIVFYHAGVKTVKRRTFARVTSRLPAWKAREGCGLSIRANTRQGAVCAP